MPIKKFFSDAIETWLRRLEKVDEAIVLNAPERTFFPVLGKRYESKVYNTAKPDELTHFDALMNKIVIGSLMLLGLELLLDSFELEFAAINLGILFFFTAEFCIRFNYRRFQYLKAWGIWVDLPIICIETVLLWQVYTIYFLIPEQVNTLNFLVPGGNALPFTGVLIEHNLPITADGEVPDWVETLALWKGLRLLRLLRVFKLIRDVAKRKKVWEQRITSFFAYIHAFVEALLIMVGVLLIVVIITKFVSDQDPEKLIRAFIKNIVSRLRANQETGVENSDVLQAIYQVFAILSAMIIVTFFTQLLLPIARRIQASKEVIKQEQGKSGHVIIAVVDNNAIGLVEEALQVWGVYVGKEIVLIVPDDAELDDPLHPKCSPEVIRGSIYSRGSWLAADAGGAEQILILSTAEIEPTSVSIFLPEFQDLPEAQSVLIVMREAEQGYRAIINKSGVRFACISVEALVESIESNVTDKDSIQYAFVKQLGEKLDSNSKMLGTLPGVINDAEAEAVAENLVEYLKSTTKIKNVNCRSQDGLVLLELDGDPAERDEGELIEATQLFLNRTSVSTHTFVFVDSLHLVGINSQLGNNHTLRIVPIELLLMFAAYHETICPEIIKGWLLPKRALEKQQGVSKISSPFSRTTYRNRAELHAALASENADPVILGLMSSNNGGVFKAYLTNSLDTRKIFPDDLIVAIE